MFRFWRRKRSHNEFTFINQADGIGFYRWDYTLHAYVEEVARG